MIIQISHSRHYPFKEELYDPIKSALFFPEHSWIFPHEEIEVDSKITLRSIDLLIAEVSSPTTGNALEIGMASAYGKRILCISKKGSKISSSLEFVSKDYIEYEDTVDMVTQVGQFIEKIEKRTPRIYVGCSLTHATPEFRQNIADFKDSLRKKYDVLDFLGVFGGDRFSANDVWRHDRGCVLESDIFIAECSYPSTGLGYEIASAVEYGKKILLIAHRDALVTRMILGIPPERATFFRYETLEEVCGFITENY